MSKGMAKEKFVDPSRPDCRCYMLIGGKYHTERCEDAWHDELAWWRGRLAHVTDNVNKGQWLNVASVVGEMIPRALKNLSHALKG